MKSITTKLAAAAFSTLLIASPSMAGPKIDGSGNYWLSNCETPSGFGAGMCYGFIMGTIDGYLYGATFAWLLMADPKKGNSPVKYEKHVKRFCMPGSVTNEQIKDIFIKYLRQYPEQRHLSGDHLLIDSLVAVYACP